jgi:DNA-binding MarR family transcriptional regulator
MAATNREAVSASSNEAPADDKPIANQEKLPSVPEARFDLLILRSIRRIIRAVDIYSSKLKTTCRLTAPQLICLTSIVENSPTTATKVAKAVFLSASTVVGILDRLEAQGLVTRVRDTNDRRVVNIEASEKGVKLVREAPSPLQDRLAEALKQLPELEQATIALSLQRIVELMEAGHLEAAPILETDQPNNNTQNSPSTARKSEQREMNR